SSGQRLCDAFQAADVGWIEGADICDEVSWRMALALSTSEDHHPSAATNCDRSTRNCSDRPVKLTSMAVHCAEPGTSTTAEGVADAASGTATVPVVPATGRSLASTSVTA